MADFKLGLADFKLVSYPRGLKSIKSKLGMAGYKLGMTDFLPGWSYSTHLHNYTTTPVYNLFLHRFINIYTAKITCVVV